MPFLKILFIHLEILIYLNPPQELPVSWCHKDSSGGGTMVQGGTAVEPHLPPNLEATLGSHLFS